MCVCECECECECGCGCGCERVSVGVCFFIYIQIWQPSPMFAVFCFKALYLWNWASHALKQWCPIMCHGGPRVCRFSFQPITTPTDSLINTPSTREKGTNGCNQLGVAIGWSENLHTLGPPWHMIGHPCFKWSKTSPSPFTILTLIEVK